MKNITQLCLSIFLLVFLVSCQEQKRTHKPKSKIRLTENLLSETIPTTKRSDTIYIANAPSGITRKIRKLKDSTLLIAAFNDVTLYDGKVFSNIPKPESFKSFDAFDALKDTNGNIWIASTHFGVFQYSGANFVHFTTDNGLVHNRVMAIHEDDAGNIWIATMGGVSIYNGTSFQNFTTKEGLPHNDVNIIMEDKTGKIWLGTRETVSVYNPLTSTFTEIANNNGKSFKNVWSIIQDKKDHIWIGGEDGLWRYNGSSFTNFSTEFINCIYEDEKGNIWTTSSEGSLKRYDNTSLPGKKVIPIEVFKSNSMIFWVTEDYEGSFWVGTLKGVFKYKEKKVSFFRNLK